MKPCPTCEGTGLFCVSMSRDFCMECFGTGDADFEPDEHTHEDHEALMCASFRRANSSADAGAAWLTLLNGDLLTKDTSEEDPQT